MKKAATVALVLWSLIPACTGCSSKKAPVNRTVQFDLGKVLPGTATKTTARLTNQEAFAVRLVRAEVTCGCLTPEVEPTEIAPGGEAIATLTLAHPEKEGPFEQRASLVFAGTDGQEIVYTILIRGATLPWISATPAFVDFGRHMLGDRCDARTQLQFSDPIAASELEVECSNRLISVILLAGETEAEKTLQLTYDTARSTSNPEPEGYVRIIRKKTSFSYNLPYKAVFDSLYKVEPDRLSLGIVAAQKPVTVPLHFSSSTLDFAKGNWRVDSAPEGLKVKILNEKCEKEQGVANQTIMIELLPIKPGIYRGMITFQHEQTRLRLELPCSLMARHAT